MQLSELTAYAEEKYHLREQHKWEDFPGFSVLADPDSGKWIALLMRQWDMESGTEIERCDLKCGAEAADPGKPYLTPAVRMRGRNWIGIAFDGRTETEVVLRLFDRAVLHSRQGGYTFVLEPQPQEAAGAYRDTPLPFAASRFRAEPERMPERIRQLRRMFTDSQGSPSARAKSFVREARFMQDYEDEARWTGEFLCYFPTYHDLNPRQLRGYFGWRTKARAGEFLPIAASAAYIYLYELLNGVGASSPGDCLEKLGAFERGFLEPGIGDGRMRQNLHRWMLEYAVIHDLPPEMVRQYADPDMLAQDEALAALREPEAHSDETLFEALLYFGGRKTADSPVMASDPERGRRLFCEVWRAAAADRRQGKDLFTRCFGEQKKRSWYPLSNAVYVHSEETRDREYRLTECRTYSCRGGEWQVSAYEKLFFDRKRLQGLLHTTDARLRRYQKTGRYLREKPEDAWAVPYIDAVIGVEKQALAEAARPRIEIDLAGLEQIRLNAALTRDSLLTPEELGETPEPETYAEQGPAAESPELPLDGIQIRILRELLRGGSAAETIRENHLMPTIAADLINEALFDEIGDSVLVCEDERLFLVEDYREELENMLGGADDGC